MTERLQVHEIDDDEGQRLMRIIRRGSGSVVTWRRAQMVLLSAQGMHVPAIAKVAFISEDRVWDVIRNFNADGFGSLYPKYRGDRPPKFTLAPWREIKRKVAVALLMRSQLWTRKVAVALLISLFALTAAFTIVGILVKSLSTVASIISALSQAATLTIALFMPLSGKDEARRKMRTAMSQYVILDSLKAGQDDKGKFLNRVINRMRELAPAACFREKEIAEYLESTDVGERFAALASVQWQWKDKEAYKKMSFFTDGKKSSELPGPSDHPSRGYFPQLLKILCDDSWDEFQNYHAMVAMWSMVASLEPKRARGSTQESPEKQELFKRVLDQSAAPVVHKCKEWGKFIEDLTTSANH